MQLLLLPLDWPLKMTRTPMLPAHPKKAEAAVYIILGRGADLEERIRRKREEERACHGAWRPLAAWGDFGFWGHVPRRPALPPPPPPPPHEVLANRPVGHKVAASPQDTQPSRVTPERHGPNHQDPACGLSLHREHCLVSTSFLSAIPGHSCANWLLWAPSALGSSRPGIK